MLEVRVTAIVRVTPARALQIPPEYGAVQRRRVGLKAPTRFIDSEEISRRYDVVEPKSEQWDSTARELPAWLTKPVRRRCRAGAGSLSSAIKVLKNPHWLLLMLAYADGRWGCCLNTAPCLGARIRSGVAHCDDSLKIAGNTQLAGWRSAGVPRLSAGDEKSAPQPEHSNTDSSAGGQHHHAISPSDGSSPAHRPDRAGAAYS